MVTVCDKWGGAVCWNLIINILQLIKNENFLGSYNLELSKTLVLFLYCAIKKVFD